MDVRAAGGAGIPVSLGVGETDRGDVPCTHAQLPISVCSPQFDKDKLNWMNGQILRNMDDASLVAAVGRRLVEQGLTSTAEGPWIETFALMSRKSLEVLADVEREFLAVLSYPLSETMASDGGKELVEDGFRDIALAMVAQHEAGTLEAAAKDKSFKSVINAVGKEHERKGKVGHGGRGVADGRGVCS